MEKKMAKTDNKTADFNTKSTMGESKYSTYSSEGLKGKPIEAKARTFTIACSLALLTLAALAAVIRTSRSTVEDDEDDQVLPVTLPPGWGRSTTPEEVAPEEPDFTPNTTRIPPTTPNATEPTITKAPKPLVAETLFCTFGQATNESTVFPADGLCDFIFFDSAYTGGKNTFTDPKTFQANLKSFLVAVPGYADTEFGVGFASKYRDAVKEDLQGTNPVLLDIFWSRGIFHMGVIDVPVFETKVNDLPSIFECLQVLGVQADKAKKMGKSAYVALGISVYSKVWRVNLQEAMRDRYNPDIFIARGHYAYGDQERENCIIMPPTSLVETWYGRHAYPYTLSSTMDAVEIMQGSGANTTWLLSVTMKGRWTPKRQNSDDDLGSVCVQDLKANMFGSYTEVCNHKEYAQRIKYDDKYDIMYARKTDDLRVFRYDDEKAFSRKLCKVKANHTIVKYGIAVYDLEYEDYHGLCARQKRFEGPYSRLQALRKIADFTPSFTGPEHLEQCFKLIPHK